ncbi:hypothetical protein [Parasphingopyxis marina]|uniref:Uncharacterized protein n=1 Tax=Parasphingopyxis marina TaxID=2761622 RepID=A0A842HYF6_9SPHN|nr:hypothetical protein [Parasphingopyxis marina]MBC2777369.1 hypothetical protein [Parasphingopyxis marina]
MKFLGISSRTAAALCATVSVVGAGSAQQTSQGTTEYWMTADTASGMASMMGGGATGGGGPDPSAAMRMMMGGGGGQAAHLLNLRLASPRTAANPEAEHVPPAVLGAGHSLPLVTPPASRRAEARNSMVPEGMERPRGRILIYWGCGDHARPGQPVVVDFAQLSAGEIPAAFGNAGISGIALPGPESRPGYGEWPNQRTRTSVPATGSLVGGHVVRGNYTPEISFTLTQQQDFLDPVRLTASEAASSGAVPLAWAPVPGSRAWLATVFGGTQRGDVIMWSSSEVQALPMALGMGHFSDADLARGVRERQLLPGETARCTVPAEVAGATEGAMLSLTAFGGEASFAHPVRPANAPASWRPEWTVTLLRKSSHMSLLGLDMSDMMGASERNENPAEGEGNPRRRTLLDRLRGQ